MEVYSLVAEPGDREGKAIRVVADLFMLSAERTLTSNDIVVTGQDDDDIKQSAKRGAWIAYQELRRRDVVHPNSEIPRSGVIFEFDGDPINQVKGPSAGLCFLVKMAQVIIEDFLRLAGKEIPVWDCAATGILTNFISIAEEVGKVDAIGAKIKAALASLGREGVVFYPRTNDPLNPALRQEAEQKQITLVVVDTPRQAIDLLLEKYGILEGADGGGGEAEPERDWLKWILRGLLLCSIVALGWFITSWLRAPSLAVPQKPATTTSIETAPLRTEPVPQPAVDAALYYEGKTGEPVPLPQEKGLTEGDGFRVRLEVDRDCFVYIFGLDGNQSLKWLFPAHSSSRLLFGEKHWIPEDGRWFYLDDITGEETILIWATPSPSSWLEDMWNKLPEHNEVRAFPSPKLESDLFAYLQDEEKKGRGTQKRLTFQHE